MLFKGDRLREIREKRGLSQRELAERCNISDLQVHRYEVGKNDPSASILGVMAGTLGVSTDYLLGIVSNPDPHALPNDLEEAEHDLLETYRRDGWLGVLRLTTDRLTK
jgi:transcriptional regulator with XRE-family HTH domain